MSIGALYADGRGRISDLVSGLGEEAAAPVPACPQWSVHDVVAHVTGLYADIVSGNLEGAGTDAWTGAQVERRRGVPIDELLAESDDVGPKLAAMLDDFPGRYGAQVVAAIHSYLAKAEAGPEAAVPAPQMTVTA